MLQWAGFGGWDMGFRIGPRHGSRWLPDGDEALRLYAAEGSSGEETGHRLGRTEPSVRKRASTLKISFHSAPGANINGWTAEEDETLRQCAAAGGTTANAAARISKSLPAIRSRADRLGIRLAPGRILCDWTDARLELTGRLWKAGWSAARIAKELGAGITKNAVIGKLTRLKCKDRSNGPSRSARGAQKRRLAQLQKAKKKLAAKRQRPGKISAQLAGTRGWFSPPRDPKFPVAPATDVARIAHNDLDQEHCRWPIGDPAEVAIHREPFFCGAQREEGLPYCRAHCRRAFTVVSAFPHHCYPTPGII